MRHRPFWQNVSGFGMFGVFCATLGELLIRQMSRGGGFTPELQTTRTTLGSVAHAIVFTPPVWLAAIPREVDLLWVY
jgi:hypothetical protein